MVDETERPRPPPNRRRDKPQLSCDACRHRKLKCDRERPCSTCIRRGLAKSCHFVTTPSSAANSQRGATAPQPSGLHGRISELENLVVSLLKGQNPSRRPTHFSNSIALADELLNIQRSKSPKDELASPADPGTLNLSDTGSSYVQSGHWEAVLAKIRGLKEDFVVDSKLAPGSNVFYGPRSHATRDEILSAMPARPLVDRLMALHFDTYMITPYLIHSKKFLQEYEAFWNDMSTTPIAWIGLLFSMLCVAAQLQAFTNELADNRAEAVKLEYLAMKDTFREKSMQCLMLARYTRGGPHVLESLITILIGEFILLKDGANDGWLMISTILHIAMRMGYHRDPDHFPEISPFEAEMRRRIWTTILQLDLALSLEMGLPRNAMDMKFDTKEPQNLLDSDFEESTAEMPLPRPETEWTPVLPLIAKRRLTTALGPICDINANMSPPSYHEVIRVADLLEDIHSRGIPAALRWMSDPFPITDSPNLVMQRISIETTYLKSRILLYRRAIITCPVRLFDERQKNSVRICLDSALQILGFQQMLHEESQPFGRLAQLRWKITHIYNQDVLLAASVLCLYLQDVDKFESLEILQRTAWKPRAAEIRKSLTISHAIWLETSKTSAEAGKVAKALAVVLGLELKSAEMSEQSASHEYVADFDLPMDGFETTFTDPYLPSAFYSPLTFFDNVLESYHT